MYIPAKVGISNDRLKVGILEKGKAHELKSFDDLECESGRGPAVLGTKRNEWGLTGIRLIARIGNTSSASPALPLADPRAQFI